MDRLPRDFRRSESSGTEQAWRRAARKAHDGSGDVWNWSRRARTAPAPGVQQPTARHPVRAGHPGEFLANSFFLKILVTLSSENFMPVARWH
jgi:hypothetical protein